MDMHAGPSPFCPQFHHAVELIGRRWTGAVIRALLSGITRFSELTAAIPGLSDRMLSERLKELEAEGLVRRLVIPETPVRVVYQLTEKGRALGDVVEAVSAWAAVWGNANQCGEAAAIAAATPALAQNTSSRSPNSN
jgi:DNA-binding HxlR family transcriptional regulator